MLLALEAGVARTLGEEVTKRAVLVPQALGENRCGNLREPLMSTGALPLGESAREVIPSEDQPALAVGCRTDLQGSVPQPAGAAEPAIEQAALCAVGIGSNPVAAYDVRHGIHSNLAFAGRSAEIQHRPPGTRRANGSSRRGRGHLWPLQ